MRALVLCPHAAVEPRDSSWFSELNAQLELVPLQDLPLYKVRAGSGAEQLNGQQRHVATPPDPIPPHLAPQEDWIGLRRLHEAGHLSLLDAPGQHMQFTLEWFEENVLWGHLAGDEPTAAAKQQ